MRKRRVWVLLLVLGVIAAAAALLLSKTFQRTMLNRAAVEMTAAPDRALLADDALRVAVCGSSAPLPSPSRAKSCVAVFAGGKFYLVDVGPESVENLVTWNLPLAEIGGVLLTHFQSDHIGDLGELNLQTWAGGRPGPLAVYGGPGVEQVVQGFGDAYRHDQAYRTAHHTARVMPPETWPMAAHPVSPGPVLVEGELRITAFEADHPPIVPAYGYRFDYKGRSVVVTGDTRYHPRLVQAASGADVLVCEAIARPMVKALEEASRAGGSERRAAIMHDIQDYHIAPEEAARLANEANVRLLVLYHLLPAPDGFLPRQMFAGDMRDVRADGWTLAEDGSLYTLPTGTDEVKIGSMP